MIAKIKRWVSRYDWETYTNIGKAILIVTVFMLLLCGEAICDWLI